MLAMGTRTVAACPPRFSKVAALVGVGSGTVRRQEGDGGRFDRGSVIAVETGGKDNSANPIVAVRATVPSPTKGALPFTSGYQRFRTSGAAG